MSKGMSKLVSGADEAVSDIFDGAILTMGGFGFCGIPENTISAPMRNVVKNLTYLSNNEGEDGFRIVYMLKNKSETNMISS